MNRNTLLAFVLILGSVWFFTSRPYYEKILRRPHPASVREQQAKKKGERDSLMAGTARTETANSVDLTTVEPTTWESSTPDSTASVADGVGGDTVWVITDVLECGIAEVGGRLVAARMREFTYDNSHSVRAGEVVDLVPRESDGALMMSINGQSTAGALFRCESVDTVGVTGRDTARVSFVWEPEGGPSVVKTFAFSGGGYEVGLGLHSRELDGKSIEVAWPVGIEESERGAGQSAQYDVRKAHLYDGRNVEHLSSKKESVEERTGYYRWVGLTSKYFIVALIPDSVKDADITISGYLEAEQEDQRGKREKPASRMNYRVKVRRFATGPNESYRLYLGPAKLSALKGTGVGLQKILFGGWKLFFRADRWFPALCELVLWLLVSLHGIVKDYGIVIIILTLLSKIVTYPLTQSSMKSMNRMKEVQPKIAAIREKYKGSPAKMNEKLMALYKQEGVSPFQMGCLPMVLQMPVFISLFVVLRKAIELRGSGTFLVPWIHDLSRPEVLFEIPTLPLIGGIYGNNFALLPVAMAALTYFQQKATIKDPNQKAMIYFMPIFMLVIFNSFPAGLVLYWTFSSAVQLVQQYVIDRRRSAREAG